MAVVLALISALSYGVSDFSGGLAARRVAATAVVLVSNALSLLLAVAAVLFLPGSTLHWGDLGWGAAAGAVGVVGVVLLYRGLALGPMAVVAPLTAVLSAAVPVVAGVAMGERPGAVALAGVLLAVPAMVLISRPPRSRASSPAGISRAALLSALCAGVSFGGFFVLLARTSDDGGAWPLVGQRAVSVGILVAIVGVTAVRRGPVFGDWAAVRLALVAGVTDFAANLAYVLATHHGLLALVAVVSSLYPASTVLLARTVLGERLQRPQVAGVVLAGAAVTLIALR